MSRNINVNPAHYKVAGRERQGEGILQAEQKQAFATQQGGGAGDGVPPWEATRHTFVSAQPEPEAKPKKKPRKAAKAKKKTSRAMPKKSKRAAQTRGKMRSAKPSQKKVARRSRRKK